MDLPKKVNIVEVGPRDGLQNESIIVPVSIKLEYIQRLENSGLKIIEVTSFVSPKWVPQMADHTQLIQQLVMKSGIKYPALIPNQHGMLAAIDAGIKDICVFTATTEKFSKKNANCFLSESMQRIEQVIDLAKKHHISIRGYISCVIACPYEGYVDPHKTALIAERLIALGCEQVSLGDTIGVGTPGEVKKLLAAVLEKVPAEKIAVHFHDTYGQALANIYVSLEHGIQTIDSSSAGLGGCPYAGNATGNVPTEDVIYMLNGLGIETGVSLPAVVDAGRFICQHLGHPPQSKLSKLI